MTGKKNVLRPKSVTLGKYIYCKSTRPGKKLMVKVNGKIIHFGDANMEHYKDRTGFWKSKDHGDKARRVSYRKRAGGIKGKDGKPTFKNPNSANYHSYNVLW